MNFDRIKSIRMHGKKARGQKELLKHLQGHRLTLKQATNAFCYGCTGYYADGKVDCGIKLCPLRPFMPYATDRVKKIVKRTIPVAHMEKMRAARQ